MSENEKKFILTFEEYCNKHSQEPIWKDINEIAKITGDTESNVVKYIHSFDEFIENSKGEYTTVNLYEKNTSFFKKLFDQIKNKID